MAIYDVIKFRRSCRVFSDQPVERDKLDRITEAATWAPSGKNRQNYRVFVVAGGKKDELVSIADRSFPLIEPSLKEMYDEKIVNFTRNFFKTLGGAPVLLVFYSVPTEEGQFVDMQSVSAAVQNALLAATGPADAGRFQHQCPENRRSGRDSGDPPPTPAPPPARTG